MRASLLVALIVVELLAGCATATRPLQSTLPEDFKRTAFDTLYIDMDGTLLGTDHRIRPESLTALREYRNCGGRVGIATGRTIEQVRPYLKEVQPDLPLVLVNGAIIYDHSGSRVLRQDGLRPDTVGSIVEALASSELAILGMLAQYEDGKTLADRDTAAVAHFLATAGITLERSCPFDKCVVEAAIAAARAPLKLLVLAAPPEVLLIQRAAAELVKPHARAVVGNQRDGVIEVLAPSANKGDAIKWALQETGHNPQKWAAIGDSQNDVEMVSFGALGLAMAGCHPDTCAAADEIIGSNDGDAIAAAVRNRIMTPACSR